MNDGRPEPSSSEKNEEEESLSKKARETGQILKELVDSIGRKSKAVAERTSIELKEAAKDDENDVMAKDAADIQMLGSYIESIITNFEDTLDRIRQHPSYEEQHRMLVGFKKMLEEEVNVINARLSMAKRLKHLEPSDYSETIEEKIEERKTINAIDGELVNPPLSERDEEARTMAEMVEENDKDKV